MEEKLKSILKIIPWLLAARAVAFGAAWWLLPYGWFILASLLLYFLPFFQPARTALPFFVLLGTTLFLPEPNLWLALLLSVLMFLILGVKDLLLVNRASASEALFFTLSFLIILVFFGKFSHPGGLQYQAYLIGMPILIFFLLNHLFFHYGGEELTPNRRAVGAGTLSIIVFELLWVASVLPMSRYLQTGMVLVSLLIATELVLEGFRKTLTRRGGLVYFSVWFALMVLMLTANSWSVWSSVTGF